MKGAALLLAVLLGGCAALPTEPHPVTDPQQAWLNHRLQMEGLKHWALSGRLAIQVNDEGWQIGINWQQKHDAYEINLTAPFGQGSMRICGDHRFVHIRTSDGNATTSTDVDALLQKRFGWQIPLYALRYWAVGLPAPGESEPQIDPYGHLASLQQQGWSIRFLDYQNHGDLTLPGRVFASNYQARIRLVIDTWRVDGGTA